MGNILHGHYDHYVEPKFKRFNKLWTDNFENIEWILSLIFFLYNRHFPYYSSWLAMQQCQLRSTVPWLIPADGPLLKTSKPLRP